jgi:methyl-accepting chemotaxis protein
MSRLSDLSLRTKLAGSFGVTLLLLVVLAVVASTSIGTLNDDTGKAAQGAFLDEQIMSMEIAVREALSLEAEAILDGEIDQKALDAAWISNGGDAFGEALEQARGRAVEGMPETLDGVEAAAAKVEQSVARTIELAAAGDTAAARENRDGSTEPAYAAFLEANQEVEAVAEAFSEEAAESASATASGGKRTILIFTILALLAAATFATLITRGLTRGVAALTSRLRSLNENCVDDLDHGLAAMAEGDLTNEVVPVTTPIENPGGDEIGRLAVTTNELLGKVQGSVASYNTMREQIGGIIGEISRTSVTLASASQQMATTSQEAGRATDEIARAVGEVAQGAERQVRKVEETRALSEEMTQATGRGTEQAAETASAAQQAREVASDGAEAVTRASEAIESVRSSSEHATEAIRELGARSAEISGIVETITGIAEQTNLLALNAAIEAARAGEQGRGFAVVAEEVRKLAEESQQAAGSIAQLIGEIQSETDKVIGVVEDGAGRTVEGVETVEQARESFERIAQSVTQVTERAEEIASVIGQIADSSQRMHEDMGEVASVAEESSAVTEQVSASTQQTSASTQQIAASSQELARLAESLETLVSRFSVEAS